MCSAELKVQTFKYALHQFVYSIFQIFHQIVKDELAVLQQRAAAQKAAKTRIHINLLSHVIALSINSFSFE